MFLGQSYCADVRHVSSRDVRLQTLTTPSPDPDAIMLRELGFLHMLYTPWTWPFPSWEMNGFANMRSLSTVRIHILDQSQGVPTASQH